MVLDKEPKESSTNKSVSEMKQIPMKDGDNCLYTTEDKTPEGCPVELVRGHLFMNLQTTSYFAKCQFKNVDDRDIECVEFDVEGLDSRDQKIEVLNAKLNVKGAKKNFVFGEEVGFKFSEDKGGFRKIKINVRKVTFADKSTWENA